MQIRCDHGANHGANRTFVKIVGLNDEDRATKSGTRTDGIAERRPPDLAPTHYHFSLGSDCACARSMIASSSESSGRTLYTASSRSRTPRNLSPLTYSATALAYSSLRDHPRRLAKRSASRSATAACHRPFEGGCTCFGGDH